MTKRINRVEYTLSPSKEKLSFKEIKVILRCADPIIASGGRSLLAKIVKGSKDKKVVELQLDKTPGYGFFASLSLKEIGAKIDRVITDGYLKIEYDGRLPVICYSDKGWEIEQDTYSDDLFEKTRALFDTDNLDFIDTLKDRNRDVIFLLLDKIADSGDRRFIPLLEYWKSIDYKKVQARIGGVIKRLEGGVV